MKKLPTHFAVVPLADVLRRARLLEDDASAVDPIESESEQALPPDTLPLNETENGGM